MKKMVRGAGFLLALILGVSGCNASSSSPAAASAPPASAASASSAAASSPSAASTDSTAASGAASPADTSKFVTLSMYLIGSPAQDYDAMIAALNDKMKADINANLKVTWIGWGDYSTKYPLVLASGEPIDLLYTSNWLSFVSVASKGAFMPLEDLAPVYCPQSWAAQTDGQKKTCTVNGHIYALSPKFSQYGAAGYIVRGDLMKQMGLTAINSMDDFGTYCAGIIKNAPNLDPTGFDSQTNMDWPETIDLGYYGIAGIFDFPLMLKKDSNGIPLQQVVNYYDDPALPAFYTKMQQWAQAGYWPSNVLSNTDTNMLVEGKAACQIQNYDHWSQYYSNNPSWDLQFFPVDKHAGMTSAVQDAMAVGAHATNPERALMLLELLRTNESYYDLMTYGRTGVDYNITPEGKIKATDPNVWTLENYCSWGFKDPQFFKVVDGYPPTYQQVIDSIKSTGVNSPFVDFAFNPDPVKNQVAAISAVMAKYHMPLVLGYVSDPVSGLDTLNAQLKTAGIDAVQAEMQKQIDAYMAGQ